MVIKKRLLKENYEQRAIKFYDKTNKRLAIKKLVRTT